MLSCPKSLNCSSTSHSWAWLKVSWSVVYLIEMYFIVLILYFSYSIVYKFNILWNTLISLYEMEVLCKVLRFMYSSLVVVCISPSLFNKLMVYISITILTPIEQIPPILVLWIPSLLLKLNETFRPSMSWPFRIDYLHISYFKIKRVLFMNNYCCL